MSRPAIEVLTPAAAVLPTSAAIGRLTPLGADRVTVKGGLWGQRLKVNRERSIPHGFAQLDRAGNLANFRLAAGVKGRYRALNEAVGVIYPVPRHRRLQVARGRGLGARPTHGPRACETSR